ncbi:MULTISPECIES: hypothetical protein [unclassified Streptomyces]|uniref:hypothetical protein n=1 Tax=unclassified Streptomyces TaxID=2593676 RepID=UPI000F6F61E0|nr:MULTISPECIES: hypothetical protein [unclassified Streptomyces]AZM93853.1 hypothetical protein D1J60_35665 [Streptomyces sp. W1SF4]RSS64104.1 hypothetical protein EF912_02290 [Streptomyces sp. WAC07061]
MAVATLMPATAADLSDFDLELDLAVSAELDASLQPMAGFTKITCGSKSATSTIISCVDELGPTCCA